MTLAWMYGKYYLVPTCPICEKPVSVPRGEDPNIKVNQHIQNNCASPKPLDNTCKLKGCKQKLLVPMTCSDCKLSYCVKHRLGIDHQCPGKPAPTSSPSALAAIRRANKAKQSKPHRTKAEIEQNKQEISRLQAKAKTGRLAESEEIRLATLLSMKDQGSDKCILS
ncbi:hypothetical protein J3Q64DRAFT_1809379 [Phycomyces blakesleeanus]|uniref:AN1-type domain-containing protein n=1 Tax=Phycomyces blakesleeanus TaxID=4837 RepID=A0ABR3B1N1_PHYBL